MTRKNKVKSLLLLAVAVIISVSCTQELISKEPSHKQAPPNVAEGMRYFDDFNEAIAEAEKLNELNLDELIKYEESIGFNSFGKLADVAYEQVLSDSSSYSSMNDEIEAISLFPQYLYLISDEKQEEYTCETRLYNNPYKYIINEDFMFQVKDKLVKVFESGILYANIDDYPTLMQINNNDMTDFCKEHMDKFPFIEGDFFGLKDVSIVFAPSLQPANVVMPELGGFCRHYDDSKRKTINGRLNKFVFELELWQTTYYSIPIDMLTWKMRSYRKGIWNGVLWKKDRNNSCDLDICVSSNIAKDIRHFYHSEYDWNVVKHIDHYNLTSSSGLHSFDYIKGRVWNECMSMSVDFRTR